ncbi:FadR/GntR family transcriptional regulator [Bartonella apis]|uniref:DNA-binding transcriptional regulator, FadR family n=1 Tax=Bartonella apis TaxID=1686310 RepID=A0A1R0F7U3_9HYPH|nr:FadR/GntR family transcriptional regulator [Bartonella apis]OLY43027.1 DNA-binding transcriptional regulator, FadR family [Bartonella apis]OLY46960.1 DNA-binding transcriptional regulator, FadR family [Bartonella apis]
MAMLQVLAGEPKEEFRVMDKNNLKAATTNGNSNDTTNYPPVRRRATLADQIVDVLRSRITSGNLAVGDQLPTEQQLSDGFQVSRAVVREAIARLKQTGLIRTQQGRGAFVIKPNNPAEFLKLDFHSGIEPSHVMELRRVIEVAAARFAAQRRTDDDIARLDREIAILENAGNDLDQRVEADMRFHQAIAVASGNPLFVLVLEKLHETMTDFLKLAHGNTSKVAGAFQAAEKEHRAIAEAILNGDKDKAGNAMLKHLERSAIRLSIFN